MDHCVACASTHRSSRAISGGVGDSGDDRGAVLEFPTQIVVDMPLHQVASKIKQFRVIDGDSGFGDKHGGYKRALVAINFVHKRFGGRRIKEFVVLNQASIDVVLKAS